MRILKWVPWRFFVTRTARAYGFLDPIQFLAKLRQFAHPSEVSEPVELLRAGVLFHARGLINTKAIQHNLDWVWPYWVERQFNPADPSFIPRAFSFSHINVTHRNWTAVGLPDIAFYPIIDPRGLVTPLFDGWSLDFWIVGEDGRFLLPSKLEDVEQQLELGDNIKVRTTVRDGDWAMVSEVSMEMAGQRPHCVMRLRPRADASAHLAVVLRPYNPEGISFIETVQLQNNRHQWLVNGKDKITFDRAPEISLFSTYKEGDVWHALEVESHRKEEPEHVKVVCPVSMASGAVLFPISDVQQRPLEVHVPILDELVTRKKPVYARVPRWRDEIDKFSRLEVPDETIQKLYDIHVANLILFAPSEVYPGPYTYKRFWFRDAALILNAMISLGATERSHRALDLFPNRQTRAGYFLSQEGEWDSNGEAIWILHRYHRLSGRPLSERWLQAIAKGARWIKRKRLPKDIPEVHAGLLPAGFSAEHLGPNDYYYWDDFWSVAGLRCAADLFQETRPALAQEFGGEADDLLQTIIRTFDKIPDRHAHGAIPASPHRRMDAGAIGSIVADFPLQLFAPGEARLMRTADYLIRHSSFDGGFFQNMIHSGINPYLTLHLAQVLLRGGDPRFMELIDATARLATSTGQWPEAIHPLTKGGCMGDGQHIWAAAEWAMMIRNLFVREEEERLMIGAGVFPRWLQAGQRMFFGPTLTPFGPVSVEFEPQPESRFQVRVQGDWRESAPALEVAIPGYALEKRAAQADSFFIRPAP